MNQLKPVNNFNAPPKDPVKRKRGRPRKDQSLKRRVVAPMPPTFEAKTNGNQPHQLHIIDNANDGMVGQTVTGVIQAAFDSGYLLTVQIGNSNASLSGVVFKPGHYVPISKENDVAPNVQTIRTEVFLPKENQTRKRRPRSKGRMEQHRDLQRVETIHLSNGLTVANIVKPPPGLRGTVVPVVLQPVNLSNGLLTANQVTPPSVPSQASHMAAMKMTVGSSNQNHPFHRGLNGKSSAEDSGRGLEGDTDKVNEPIFPEPLQIIDFDITNQTEPVAKPSGNNYRMGMGQMTALLQGNRTEPGA